VLAPEKDDPSIADDPQRNNNFNYAKMDLQGYAVPLGSHILPMNRVTRPWGASSGYNEVNLALHKFGSEFAQAIGIRLSKLSFNSDVLSFGVTKLAQSCH
jgi:hypothetical protein